MKALMAALLLTFSLSSFATAKKMPAEKPIQVKMETNYGEILIELNEKKAPITVKNFLRYTKNGFYDGTIFHRVIDGFMIQGGGLTQNMQKKPTLEQIQNEAHNGLTNDEGTIAMARTSDINSATSQFFINVNNNDFLNHKARTHKEYGYTVFGRVIKGMPVVNRIKKAATTSRYGRRDVPVNPVIIKKVTRL